MYHLMFVLTTRQVKHPSLRHDDSDLEAKCVIFLYFLTKCYFAVVRHISTFLDLLSIKVHFFMNASAKICCGASWRDASVRSEKMVLLVCLYE